MASSFTQAQIDAFEQALADRQGAKSVTFDNQTVTFESTADALVFLAYMKSNISTNTTPRTRYAATSKGV